jgi:ATP-dependent exoDNAse (exonuclease V) beta subunit
MSKRSFSLPSDNAARLQALDIHGSFIVEAPAGSGKTGLLMQRFLHLLAESDIAEPEQVLAITFTRKAAAEMRNRIIGALQDAANPQATRTAASFDQQTRALASSALKRSDERGWHLLRQPQRLNITTIDALCAEIVRRLPLLTGISFQQPVTDALPLYHEAAQRTLRLLGGTNAALNESLRTLLLHRNGRFKECEELIAEMLQWRDQWLRLVPLSPSQQEEEEITRHALALLNQTLQQSIQLALSQVIPLIDEEDLRELCQLTHIAARNMKQTAKVGAQLAWLDHDQPSDATFSALPRWLGLAAALLNSEGEWRKAVNASIGLPAKTPVQERMQQLITHLRESAPEDNDPLRAALHALRSLPPVEYPEAHWQVARALFRVLHHACAELDVLFAERSQCDFTAISMAAVQALERNNGFNDLALAMGTRIQHLLVDEMQDTSITHYRLLEQITASWDGVSQTAFLVGDPKQSIYLFREARVELFKNAMHNGLGELPLQLLQLTANFRSQQSLIEAFNDDFSLIFNSEISDAEESAIIYAPASTVLPPTDGRRDWHVRSCIKSPNETAEQHVAEQAEEIADLIVEHLSHTKQHDNIPPSIAILVSNRSHAVPIIAALRKVGVSYSATEMDTLAIQPEVLDIAALTRALLHPGDRAAWLAVLRAPWCGLTLASLLALTHSPESLLPIHLLIEQNNSRLNPDECARLLRTWNILKSASGLANRIPLSQLVERTWVSLGGVGIAETYQRPDKTSDDVLANIECYLTLLDTLDAEGTTIDAALINHRLDKLYASPSTTQQVDVVILTIHKAKGLEWDVVFVPSLHKRGRRDDVRLLTWFEFPAPLNGDADAVSALLSPKPGRDATKDSDAKRLTDWIRSFKSHREEEERKRLFYVACTRARHQLHLFAVAENKPDYIPDKYSLLYAAWPAYMDQHVSNLTAMPASQTPASSDIGQMAAVAEAPMLLNRIQATADSLAAFNASLSDASSNYWERPVAVGGAATPARPESSLAARAFGNVVHRWMEILASKFASGASLEAARNLISNSTAAITALLRHEGAPADQVQHLAQRVTHTLTTTLDDTHGRWLLAAHTGAASEIAFSLLRDNRAMQLRMDRIFESGPKPPESNASLSTDGSGIIWIADYKTSEPVLQSTAAFLEAQRNIYRIQLESYAEAIRLREGASKPIRLALYYPLLPALDWWEY